ncbi:MAG: serine hydrolase [Pseudomonadota bacterium]
MRDKLILLASAFTVFACAPGTSGVTETGDIMNSSTQLQLEISKLETDIQNGEFGFIDEVVLHHNDEAVFHYKAMRNYLEVAKAAGMVPQTSTEPVSFSYIEGTELHTLQSITKTVTAMLIGILETEGKIPNVSEAKVADILEDKFDIPYRDENWDALTVEHLLTMRDNLDWDEDGVYINNANDATKIAEASDPGQFVLNKAMKGPPGENAEWRYNGGASHLLGVIIQTVTGQTAAEYAQAKLFQPMNIQSFHWDTESEQSNQSSTQGGLHLQASDLIKFCHLLKKDGSWQGKKLISSGYINRVSRYTTRFASTFELPGTESGWFWQNGYGYQVWLGDKTFSSEKAVVGAGYGGQYLTCVPEKDIDVLIFSSNFEDAFSSKDLYAELGGMGFKEAGWKLRQRINSQILPLLDQ